MSTISNKRTSESILLESSKRLRGHSESLGEGGLLVDFNQCMAGPTGQESIEDFRSDNVDEGSRLPASHSLLGSTPIPILDGYHIRETDVGISEYVSSSLHPIHGVIKQRFTDFLVYEVNLDGETVHVKSLKMPVSDQHSSQTVQDCIHQNLQNFPSPNTVFEGSDSVVVSTLEEKETQVDKAQDPPSGLNNRRLTPWSSHIEDALKLLMPENILLKLKVLYLGGPSPTTLNDYGQKIMDKINPENNNNDGVQYDLLDKCRERKKTRGRGKQSEKRDQGSGPSDRVIDSRTVVTNPIKSKALRAQLHECIRELFGGVLVSETDTNTASPDDGLTIIIKWQGKNDSRFSRGRDASTSHRHYPPYIHFTMQKTNRDTQDALSHLSRTLRVNLKDLSVAGTKDKRAVTTQRVSLKRGNKTVEDIWRLANGQVGRNTPNNVLTQRGERGVRVADMNYKKTGLELGMLKGNAFLITLRNVQVDNIENLNAAMNSIKSKGFINYYGMQRFGTASVPTHSIGLAILQSDWHKAISMILGHRPGEHPDVVAARDAWLIEHDLNKALLLMPRRMVAERCILESYKKQNGETRNAMGALSTIPRTLRLMYVHAYQSYVWNAIVSERIRCYGLEKPVVGDIVFDQQSKSDDAGEFDKEHLDNNDSHVHNENNDEKTQQPDSSRFTWTAPNVKVLKEDDLENCSIFDVIMPLPGKDVAYPGGSLGDKYRAFLKADGLDPDNLVRKQKEYSLSGSYRKIVQLPRTLLWKIIRYTDPDVPLAQADEDKLLGFEPPVINENGKFIAIQIEMILGTAAYATMAIREVTKTETSSYYQTSLTRSSDDQLFRGTANSNGPVEDCTDTKKAKT